MLRGFLTTHEVEVAALFLWVFKDPKSLAQWVQFTLLPEANHSSDQGIFHHTSHRITRGLVVSNVEHLPSPLGKIDARPLMSHAQS